jgi:hypothetical protein
MNVQMPKHRVDLSTPMLLYGTQAATARAGSRLCDKGFNLVLRNLRLEPPDQTFALIVREAQVGLRGQIGPFNIANDRRLQIASIVNAFELHHPIHGGPLRREIPEPYGSFSPDPQVLSGLGPFVALPAGRRLLYILQLRASTPLKPVSATANCLDGRWFSL